MNLKDSVLKRRRRSSESGKSHRDAYSGAPMDRTVSIELKLPGNIDGNILVKSFRYLYQNLYSKETLSNYILPVMCVIGISVDPFFLFIPFVDDTKKCVGLDKRLGFNAVILRFLLDLNFLLYTIHRQGSLRILFYLPLTQVVILNVIQAMEVSKLLYTIQSLKLCVIVEFVPRIIAIYELVADKFDRGTFARAAFNLFLFMVAGHVFGSFWYIFAIEREIECWKEACLSHTGCGRGSFYCGDNLGDYRFLNGFCPTKTRDTTIYDFGIFYDALQSGVVEAIDFQRKFLYCFLWGLKTLSSFGRNLQLSGNALESFFATVMIVCALVLFFLFIGDIQVYLQSEVVRSETLRSLSVQEIEKQMSLEKHSKNLQKQSKTERSDGVAFVEQRQKQIEEQPKEQIEEPMEKVRFVKERTVQKESKTERSEGLTSKKQIQKQKEEQLMEEVRFVKERTVQKQSKTERSEGLTLEKQIQKQKEEQLMEEVRFVKERTLRKQSKTERSEEMTLEQAAAKKEATRPRRGEIKRQIMNSLNDMIVSKPGNSRKKS